MDDDTTTEKRSTRRATVLVVDDESPIGRVLYRVLDAHDVTVVTTAREALDLVAGGRAFDVILSDLMMPQMSGMALHEALSTQRPDAAERMVFMTGSPFTPAVRSFLDRVPNERLHKPFGLDAVRSLVQRFADKSMSRNSCRSHAISSASETVAK
jgi:CheY-like chemotaxis protein